MLEFIVTFLPLICIIASIIGILYGIDRLRKDENEESAFLKLVAIITSITIGIVNIIVVFEWVIDKTPPDVSVHWSIVLLIVIFGSVLLADPLKDIPIAAIASILTFGGLTAIFLLLADFSESFTNPKFLDIIPVPLWAVLLVIVVIVGIVFIVTLVTEWSVDRVLEVIGWSPIVITISVVLLIQAILMFILSDPAGIFKILGFSS